MTQDLLPHFYDTLASEIHQHNVNVGWWDNPDECIYQKLQLVSTEVAEATEGARKSLMDTHLTHREMEEVEYADTMIRLLDLGGRLHLTYRPNAHVYDWCDKGSTIGKQHLGINRHILDLARSIEDLENITDQDHELARGLKQTALYGLDMDYSSVINAIVQVASVNRGFDLFTAVQEKRLYNDQRADHKRENREKSDGKKF